MPLEVSEITVQLAVHDGPAGSGMAAGAGGGEAPPGLSAAQIDEIVARCVQRVLAALREKEGR